MFVQTNYSWKHKNFWFNKLHIILQFIKNNYKVHISSIRIILYNFKVVNHKNTSYLYIDFKLLMASKQEVETYLKELKVKIDIFGILFLDDRGKNQQTLHDLEISPAKRKEIILSLKLEDYSQGPLEEKMRGLLSMWVFGKQVKKNEVYIKVSMGIENGSAVCISFHKAERAMNYPFKK